MEPWFAAAKPITSLEPEIAFHLQDALHHGADHRTEPLALPDFPRASRLLARTSEVLGHEAQLAAYYRQVAALARAHALKFDHVRQYFWMDLRLDNEDADVRLSFPWYDTFSAMDHFFAAVAGDAEGLVYDDQDQGWALEVWARGRTLYLRQSDPDADADDESGQAVALPRAALQARIGPLRERTLKIVAFLAKDFGSDVWTPARRLRSDRPSGSRTACRCSVPS